MKSTTTTEENTKIHCSLIHSFLNTHCSIPEMRVEETLLDDEEDVAGNGVVGEAVEVVCEGLDRGILVKDLVMMVVEGAPLDD